MKKSDPFAERTSVFCVVELVHTAQGPNSGITAVISIPGREGTFQKQWLAPSGLIDVNQARDIVGWVATTADNALHKWTGVQTRLEV